MAYRAGHSIALDVDECTHLVKVHVSKLGFLDYLGIEPSPKFHHQEQHMVIGSTRKEYLPCVQLVECAAY